MLINDPSGYFEFVNTESEFHETILFSRPNPAYANTNELIGRYVEAQNALIADIQNVFNDWDQGNLANCNTDQNRKVLQGLQGLLQSTEAANVRTKLIMGHQGVTFLGRVNLGPAGFGYGWTEKQVLFHESIHALQHNGVLPREMWRERGSATSEEIKGFQDGSKQPGPTAFEYQGWFFDGLGKKRELPLRQSGQK